MLIDTVREQHHVTAFGIKCQPLGKQLPFSKIGINTTHCILTPGGATQKHQHREFEQFYILSGEGRFEIEDEHFTVKAGQLINILPFKDHVIRNISSSQELRLLSSYTDFCLVADQKPYQAVLAAPPTPNGDLHLGHLGGPYIASDIFQRYLKLRGCEVTFVSGTDDFQNYIDAYAKAHQSTSAKQVAENFRHLILSSLKSSGVEFEEFLQPCHDFSYQSFSADFFKHLLNQGVFEIKRVPTFIDKATGAVVLESEVQGLCPVCELSMSGNCCEECGSVSDVSNLVNPVHIHGAKLELVPMPRAVLKLKRFEALSRQFALQSAHADRLLGLIDRVFAQAEHKLEYPVSYPASWGVKANLAQLPGQVVNVWVEMAAGYVYLAKKAGRPFFNSELSRMSLFCGFDNAFYYAILIPALLYSYDQSFKHPYDLHLNEFWNLSGKKFSTSRRHAIWGSEFLQANKRDDLRFYLALNRPVNQRENFVTEHFNQSVEHFGLLKLDRMIELLSQLSEHKIKMIDDSLVDHQLMLQANDLLIQYEKNFMDRRYGIKKNARLIVEAIATAQELSLRLDQGARAESDFVFFMRILATLITPYMPDRASRCLSFFQVNPSNSWIYDLSEQLMQDQMSPFFEACPRSRL